MSKPGEWDGILLVSSLGGDRKGVTWPEHADDVPGSKLSMSLGRRA